MLGTVSIDGTKIDVHAATTCSVRHDWLEAEAPAEAEATRPAYKANKAADEFKTGRRGRPPKPPDDAPLAERQSNLTDLDSALMRRSDAHEDRQADNAQAMACADGGQLILATNLVATSADAPSFAATILGMEATLDLPGVVMADTGFASGPVAADLQARGIESLVTVGRTHRHRPYDIHPPPLQKIPRRIIEPWRAAMKAKLETENANKLHKKRKQAVEPGFGIVKSAMGLVRFRLRGLHKVTTEWTLMALAGRPDDQTARTASNLKPLREADRPLGRKLMSMQTKLALLALVVALPGACAARTPPNLTAYQRNIGPGSSVGGAPTSDVGRGTPGDEEVPGVSSGRSTFGH